MSMNFQTLKWMIENLIKNFACPVCSSAIKENNVEIIGAAGSTVNIDIECPECKKHALIKAELSHSEGSMPASKDKIAAIKDALKTISGASQNTTEEDDEKVFIKDEEIVSLSQSLKNKKVSVSDLFGE